MQLVDLLRFYLSFPIDDHTGEPLSEEDVTAAHYERVQQLQRLFFKHVPKLRELALANCGTGEAACGWGCLVSLLLFSAVLAAAGKVGLEQATGSAS